MNFSKPISLIVTLFLIFFSFNSSAHSCEWETYHCPIDGTEVSFCATVSMYVEGRKRDMQKFGAVGSYYKELVNSCHTCYFSGYISDFEKDYSENEISALRTWIKKNISEPKDEADEYAICARIQEFNNASPDVIADTWLMGSYMLKGVSEEKERRKAMQLKAACYFEEAASAYQCEEKQLCAIYKYVAAEMYRRADFFKDALFWYEKAKQDPDLPEWLSEMNTEQQKLAVNNDNRNDV
ncbi:DUF2225 domain-containing protein [Robertkochia aurantiaca]|uniref:DUF2225 domain-containing protein n=1 Tax=Robertkochia aurantiaca TaxID=2873700 RepID=UPI001CC92D83|nr:DUF2225 domain-containing protein [Robertkochia sp. 3YJGBD-33]